ncbi:AfsR/SARP family transcriptional regulator [Actinophytocola oryzae]|uniref:DNA-binding SARP family transcriptional activator n=1 Tax=Actinophytocola oryzae TaxID=502181 RepID=A0A4V3FUU2_9PSEU|nr:BTAD domain-containing putative transcriptional regulator [Actinophytocola oryzae]TDV56561.1 DNA-binding SARP family transcriptional activator [Actinophytocola oryzae]
MQFRVLGPLEVCDRSAVVDLGPPRTRVVCGLLLVRPGDLVAIERFVDELWPRQPPREARALVRGYVSRLRHALRTAPGGADRVVTRKPGYLLRVRDQELDLHRFEGLVTQARAARDLGDPRRAADLFRAAHDLWRGEPFADVPHTASIAATATWLTEQRLATREEWFDAALAAGQAEEVVTDLTELTSAHPLRERLAGQLMLALYRCGRQAEALEQYRRIYRVLGEEVGVEPGAELLRLHHRILDADPALHATAPVAAAARTPRQLPRDLPTLVGRDSELAELTARLDTGTPVVVLHGAPGVGKSALAIRAAHLSAFRFPDGQLHVNLRGATPAVSPLSSAEALHQLLRALGITEVPGDPDEAAALLRTVAAGRRSLVVLDNAATAAQVRLLLPGCTVLITSRTRLEALEGAIYLHVGPLSPTAATAMLDGLVSDGRPNAEPEAIRRLAELCGHLPLGLHVAAARLNARPSRRVLDLVERLADERDRLTELAAGDVAVRTSLAVSHTALNDSDNPTDRSAAWALCLFGLLPVTEVDLDLAAAVLDTTPPAADRIVERLLNAHLVEETAPHRFHMHDLTRLFANELGAALVPEERQRAALTRLLNHYLSTTGHANALVYPHRAHHPAPEVTTPPKPLTDSEQALRWLDEQRRNVIAVVRRSWDGPPEHARLGVALALALHWYLLSGGNDPRDTIAFQEEAVAAAERLGDRRSQAYAHGNLSGNLRHIGELDRACAHGAAELAICRELGDRFGEQRALGNLGHTHLLARRPDEAISCLERQLAIAREIDAPIGQAFALVNLGKAHHQLGRSEDAIGMIEVGLAWYEEIGDHYRQCDAHEVLARIHLDLGRYDRAVDLMTRTLDDVHRIGYRFGEIWALTVLAQAHRLSGNREKARHYAEKAIANSDDLRGTQARTEALAEYSLLTSGA